MHSEPWHALLAPLPPSATVRRAPVAPPELSARGEAGAIAGWDQLTVELSAGAAGLRHLLVVVDADDRVVSANDGIMRRVQGPAAVEYHHASVGGRFEPDGRFRGTRWRGLSVEGPGGDGPAAVESEPSAPTDDDVAALRALVAEVVRRAPPRG